MVFLLYLKDLRSILATPPEINHRELTDEVWQDAVERATRHHDIQGHLCSAKLFNIYIYMYILIYMPHVLQLTPKISRALRNLLYSVASSWTHHFTAGAVQSARRIFLPWALISSHLWWDRHNYPPLSAETCWQILSRISTVFIFYAAYSVPHWKTGVGKKRKPSPQVGYALEMLGVWTKQPNHKLLDICYKMLWHGNTQSRVFPSTHSGSRVHMKNSRALRNV